MTNPSTLSVTLLSRVPQSLHAKVSAHWQSWQTICEQQHLDSNPLVELSSLGYVWACSDFVSAIICRKPQFWFELVRSGALHNSLSLADYQQSLHQLITPIQPANDVLLMQTLRQFRQQHMLRIAWRDLTGLAPTAETLTNLTELAEACIDVTLEYLHQDQCSLLGTPMGSRNNPQRMVVLGMGKLGGFELNFSSDIDLIFAFSEEGETQGARVMDNGEFFLRLGQRLIRVINEMTADGFVFRVDMLLRPHGVSGPLAMSFDGMEQYYQTQGRDWERYAMIKARVIGGDREAGKELMAMLRPFVYRRYLDFGAFEAIRDMKAMLDADVKQKGNLDNIKLGLGGIREIEFMGQTYQLIRGGSEPDLQIRGIVAVLSRLAQKGLIPETEAHDLIDSYDYLRRLENRLQMYADGQTHVLPSDALQRESIALAMNAASWDALALDVTTHRQRVHGYFIDTFALPQFVGERSAVEHLTRVWRGNVSAQEAADIFQEQGIDQGDALLQQLTAFREVSVVQSLTGTAQQRLDTLMPLLLQALTHVKNPPEALQRLLNLLQAIVRRSVYLALLIEYPVALEQLVRLCAASPWMSSLVTRYPVLLDELLDARTLNEILDREQMATELNDLLTGLEDDEERLLDNLRKFKQAQMLRVAAMDLAATIEVFEVSDQLTLLAEVLLDKVYQLAWQHMVARHGKPTCVVNGQTYYPTLAIAGYGKLGGRELGYGSDLDLVFLHDSHGESQQSDSENCVDNAVFFARLAQRMMHMMATRTATGRLYEIDTQLRPDGASGMLVSSLESFEQYQQNQAWTWEHQALSRARLIVGNAQLAGEFARIRRSVLSRQREPVKLRQDILDMRQKMRDALGTKPGSKLTGNNQPANDQDDTFHLKQDAGGMIDIEFIAQYGVLANAASQPQLLQHTATRKLLRALQQSGWLSDTQADILYDAYAHYRQRSHQRALQEKSSRLDGSEFADLRQQVQQIWQQVFNV